ncbi:MAG: Inner spore coat protein [Verrucomicrobiales bacterium]|nr:Inner spore coat protein [Verrucomicrobiales bacterium]
MLRIVAFFLLASVAVGARAESAPVIINELMYHPPGDQEALQYIELLNRGDSSVDLSGWSFAHGVKFAFPQKTVLPGHGFLVVCRNLKAFRAAYKIEGLVLGDFTGKLSHHGAKVELVNSANQVVESFKYSDQAPWPGAADGYSNSLERICPTASPESPYNWASSEIGKAKGSLGGSPGKVNSCYSPESLPVVKVVMAESCVSPGEAIRVSATITSENPIENAVLHYTFGAGPKRARSNNIPMHRISGDARSGQYEATIPPGEEGDLIRFTIEASAHNGISRIEPAVHEPRPAFSIYVTAPKSRGRIPRVALLNVGNTRNGGAKFRPPLEADSKFGYNALIYIPPSGKIEVFDFVQVRGRAGGWKVHFNKDRLLDGMSELNVIFEGPERWVLSEHLAYQLYQMAGLKPEKSGHFRLSVDGRSLGYYLFVEQPNKTFLARTKRNADANVYKIIWYANGIVEKHEKKTNRTGGYDDIVSVIENLDRKAGQAQWEYINQQFNVDEVVNYFAINMCIQNWDGFFNNYFAYHDTAPGGKWEMIPWDEDKTWGDYDGASSSYDWYTMPLTTGMNGDSPSKKWGFFGQQGLFGGQGWWRPPGPFSGPLLANPFFRKKLETRLKEICTTVFTPEQFGPVIQTLQDQLRPEVGLRAQARGENIQDALRTFDEHIESFRRQVVNRRKFLLQQLPN